MMNIGHRWTKPGTGRGGWKMEDGRWIRILHRPSSILHLLFLCPIRGFVHLWHPEVPFLCNQRPGGLEGIRPGEQGIRPKAMKKQPGTLPGCMEN
jgi:hypothetical protein